MNPKALLEAIMGGGNSMAPPVRKFLSGPQRHANVKIGPFDAYLRKSERIFPGSSDRTPTLDLANIGTIDKAGGIGAGSVKYLSPDQRQGTGQFSDLLNTLETEGKAAGHSHVYVENILNEFLPEVLARKGYTREPGGWSNMPSMYKKLALLLSLSGAGAAAAGGDPDAGA